MSTEPGNVSPKMQKKIRELVDLYLDEERGNDVEEFTPLVFKTTQQPTGNYVVVSIDLVKAKQPAQKQMAQPSLSQIPRCNCCGKPL